MSLLLDPFNNSLPDFESENEDRLLAIRELIISRATLLLISAVDLIRLAETGKEPEASGATIESDCEYVLVTGIPEQGNDVTNTLFNDTGIVRHDQRQRIPSLHTDTGNTLSAGIMSSGLYISPTRFAHQSTASCTQGGSHTRRPRRAGDPAPHTINELWGRNMQSGVHFEAWRKINDR